ncbi:MAG: type II toxin-antitoxin system HicA family toxin [Halobacteriota archaeon]
MEINKKLKMVIKTRKIASALTSKGFVEQGGKKRKKHTFYFLYVDGKKTPIRTKLSHGIDEYDDTLLSFMSKQLKFDKKEELEDFIDCTKTFEEYLSMLTDKSIIY